MKTVYGIMFLLLSITSVVSCDAQQKGPDYSKAFLVDVRTPEEFAQGSAKGAVNIPLDQVEKRIGEFKNKEEIVVFCRSGNRSSQAESILKRNGVTHVFNGGTWQQVNEKIKALGK